jgi:hypothetical protein
MRQRLSTIAKTPEEKDFVEYLCQCRDNEDLTEIFRLIVSNVVTHDGTFYDECYIALFNYRFNKVRKLLGEQLAAQQVDYEIMKKIVAKYSDEIAMLDASGAISIGQREQVLNMPRLLLQAIKKREMHEIPEYSFIYGPENYICAQAESLKINVKNGVFYLHNYTAAAAFVTNQGATVSRTSQGGTAIHGSFVCPKDVALKFRKQ